MLIVEQENGSMNLSKTTWLRLSVSVSVALLGSWAVVVAQPAARDADSVATLTIDMEGQQSNKVPVIINVIVKSRGPHAIWFRSGKAYPSTYAQFRGRLRFPSGQERQILLVNWAPTVGSSLGVAARPGEALRVPMVVTLKEVPESARALVGLEQPYVPFQHAHFAPGEYGLTVILRESPGRWSKSEAQAEFTVTSNRGVAEKRLAGLGDRSRFPAMFLRDVQEHVISPDIVLSWYKEAATGLDIDAERALVKLRSLTALDRRATKWLSKTLLRSVPDIAAERQVVSTISLNIVRIVLDLLSQNADSACVPALETLAQSSARVEFRCRALSLLGSIQTAEAKSALASLLGDSDESIRFTAACALSRHGSEKGQGLLVSYAVDRTSRWRLSALVALSSNRQNTTAQELVRAAQQDPDKEFVAKLQKRLAQRREADERARKKWQTPSPEAPKPGRPQQ